VPADRVLNCLPLSKLFDYLRKRTRKGIAA